MGSYNAIHLKLIGDLTELVDKIEKVLDRKRENYYNPYNILFHEPNPWIVISLSGFEEKDSNICEELSSELHTAAILLSVVTSSDSIRLIQYEHGKMARHLGYGWYGTEQYTWDMVEGEPQDWEENVFFSSEELNEILNDNDCETGFKEQVKKIWESKEFKIGECSPSFRTENLAKELKLSGFMWDNSYGISDSEYWTFDLSREAADNENHEIGKSEEISGDKPVPPIRDPIYKIRKIIRIVGYILIINYAFSHSIVALTIGIAALAFSLFFKGRK
jgi:hypothetical protein